jgi:hypothetical protein
LCVLSLRLICLFVCLFVCFVCLFVSLFVCLLVCLFVCLFTRTCTFILHLSLTIIFTHTKKYLTLKIQLMTRHMCCLCVVSVPSLQTSTHWRTR